jgi:hypothetical protein
VPEQRQRRSELVAELLVRVLCHQGLDARHFTLDECVTPKDPEALDALGLVFLVELPEADSPQGHRVLQALGVIRQRGLARLVLLRPRIGNADTAPPPGRPGTSTPARIRWRRPWPGWIPRHAEPCARHGSGHSPYAHGMLSPEQFFAFLLAALLITASPGPDNLMVLGMGISKGAARAWPSAWAAPWAA